jgi:hypothetical protein
VASGQAKVAEEAEADSQATNETVEAAGSGASDSADEVETSESQAAEREAK